MNGKHRKQHLQALEDDVVLQGLGHLQELVLVDGRPKIVKDLEVDRQREAENDKPANGKHDERSIAK